MKDKHGVEIAISTIVTLLITILIFSMATYLLFKWFGQAREFETIIDKQTQEQIQTALRSGNQLVVIPFSVQTAKRGEMATFAMGVRNIALTQKTFSAAISFDSAYFPDGKEMTVSKQYIESHWLGNFKTIKPFALNKNQENIQPLTIKVDANVDTNKPSSTGDYIFDVCIAADTSGPIVCDPSRPLSAFYTERIYQVTVRVV